MKKWYYWKILTCDGSLVEPGRFGDEEDGKQSLNPAGGFEEEWAALRCLSDLAKEYPWQFDDSDYVLITAYRRK